MRPAVISDRIRASLAAGELVPCQPPAAAVALTTVGDLLRPWAEVYPGQRLCGDDDYRSLFGWGPGHLRNPRLQPSPRRSRRPLPAPRRIAAPRQVVSPALFVSLAAVWAWYQGRGLAADGLTAKPFTPDGLNAFVMPLHSALSDHYPLTMCLEEFGYEDHIHQLRGVPLILPHTSHEEEGAGVVEALCSGWEGLDWLLRELVDRDNFLVIPDEDRALIKEHGCGELAKAYAAAAGDKLVDIERLNDWTDSFFAEVQESFPDVNLDAIPIITSDPSEVEVWIAAPGDIDFALAYAAAAETMMEHMPNPFDVETNDDRAADQLVHDVCAVWRRTHGLPAVPLVKTLVEIFRDEP